MAAQRPSNSSPTPPADLDISLIFSSVAAIPDIDYGDDPRRVRSLNLHSNRIVHIAGLARMEALVELNLSSNAIEKVGGLEALASLRVLDLSANRIETVEASAVAGLTSLTRLGLAHNRLSSLAFVRGLASDRHALRSLDVRGNALADVKELYALADLAHLAEAAIGGGSARAGTAAADATAHGAGGSNPVVDDPNYRAIVFGLVPRLEVLDGANKRGQAVSVKRSLSAFPTASAYREFLPSDERSSVADGGDSRGGSGGEDGIADADQEEGMADVGSAHDPAVTTTAGDAIEGDAPNDENLASVGIATPAIDNVLAARRRVMASRENRAIESVTEHEARLQNLETAFKQHLFHARLERTPTRRRQRRRRRDGNADKHSEAKAGKKDPKDTGPEGGAATDTEGDSGSAGSGPALATDNRTSDETGSETASYTATPTRDSGEGDASCRDPNSRRAKRLAASLAQAREEKARLEHELAATARREREAFAAHETMSVQLARLESELEKRDDGAVLASRLDDLAARNASLEASLGRAERAAEEGDQAKVELAAAAAKVASLEPALAAALRRVEDLEATAASAERRAAELEVTAGAAERLLAGENAKLRDQVADLQAAMAAAGREATASRQAMLTSQSEELKAAAAREVEYARKVSAQRLELDELRSGRTALEAQVVESDRRAAAAEAGLAELRVAFEEATREAAERGQLLDLAAADDADQKDVIAQLSSVVMEQKQRLTVVAQSFRALEGEATALAERVATAEADKDRASKDAEAFGKEVRSLSAKYAKAKEQVMASRKKVKRAEAEASARAAEVDRLTRLLGMERTEEMLQRISDLETEAREARAKAAEATAAARAKDAMLADQNETMASLRADLAGVKVRAAEEARQAEAAAQVAAESVKRLRSQVASQESLVGHLEGLVGGLKEERDAAVDEARKARSALRDKTETLAYVENEVDKVQAMFAAKEADLEAAHARDLAGRDAQISRLEAEVEAARIGVAAARQSEADAKRTAAAAETAAGAAGARVAAVEEEMRVLLAEVEAEREAQAKKAGRLQALLREVVNDGSV